MPPKQNKIEKEIVLNFLAYFSIPWRYSQKEDLVGLDMRLAHAWSGDELIIAPSRDPEQILHEACHWLTATDDEKALPEFGLGPAPWGDVVGAKQVVSGFRAEHQETLTSLLEVYITYIYEADWKNIFRLLNLDEYMAYFPETFEDVIRHIEYKGFWEELVTLGLDTKVKDCAMAARTGNAPVSLVRQTSCDTYRITSQK